MRRSPLLSLSRWVPLILYSALIFLLSSGNSVDVSEAGIPHADKAVHMVEYAVWAALFAWAARRTWPQMRPSRLVLLAASAGTLYGLSDELHQAFVPGREADGYDLIVDGIGSFLGALATAAFFRIRAARSLRRGV